MGRVQRYVSEELTHFVGRGLPEEDQYRLLVKVLRSGLLSPEGADVAGHVVVDRAKPLSGNEAYAPEAVCLCDIPVGDLDLHIVKYSPFGVAFHKAFAVAQGASPLFYVAADARTSEPGEGGEARAVTKAERFDAMVREHQRLQDEAAAALQGSDARTAALLRRYLALQDFLDFEVFSHTKFFRYPNADEDPENYYMEREWRMLGALRFGLDDVRRVILPQRYARDFRGAFPDYAGQLSFGSRGRPPS